MMQQNKPLRVIIYDIETSGIQASTWNLWPNNGIPYQNIIKDWFIISIAWKELGKDKVHAVSVLDDKSRFSTDPTDDYHVVDTFRKVIDGADVLVAFNGDKFDIKMFNSRLIKHDLPPSPRVLQVDPMKEIKKVAKFTSNRLDFLTKELIGEGKMSTPPGTWMKAMVGDKKAIRDMVAYNKVDVIRLEQFYLRVRRYFRGGLNVASPNTENCPTCNSEKVQYRGVTRTVAGLVRQRCQCQDCGKWFQVGKTVEKPESRHQ